MNQIQAELARFYEEEAHLRRRGPAQGRRVEWLERFVALLVSEERRSVIDIGAGPGTDGAAFVAVGCTYVGLDLAQANGVLALERNLCVIVGSLFDLPVVDASFDAVWSMSTLMHVPDADVDRALESICRVARPGAPVMIGQWGGSLGAVYSEGEPSGMRRLFDLRTVDRNRALLEAHGSIEQWEVWDTGPGGWEYHAAILRLG